MSLHQYSSKIVMVITVQSEVAEVKLFKIFPNYKL